MAAMCMLRTGLVAGGLVVLIFGGGVRAEDKNDKKEENPLRSELLKLNGASTEEIQLAKLRALVKDRAKAKKAVEEAAKMMKEAKGDKPFKYNGSLILGKAAHILRLYDIAEMFYKQQLDEALKVKGGTKIVSAYENMLDLLWDSKRYDDVIEYCEKILEAKEPKELENIQIPIYTQLIKAKAKQGKVDEALSLTKGLIELEEDAAWYFLQVKGWIQREDGKLGDAITTYTEVIDKIDASKTMKAEAKDEQKDRVRYILSSLYVDNKELDKAAKQLETLMKRHPDNPTYKNDLGFIWCDNDLYLEKSEKLIKEALVLDKKEKEQLKTLEQMQQNEREQIQKDLQSSDKATHDAAQKKLEDAMKKLKSEGKIEDVTENAAYLDSLGWVYFKLGRYKDALAPLKKAAEDEDEGNHLEIWDHLADCYVALGMKKEAVSAWEKGLKMEDVSPRDGERRRKVSEKLKKVRLELSK